jgi:hypothetical protein
MSESENLSRLASSLSLDERRNLLQKLKGQFNLPLESLYTEEYPAEDGLNLEEQYSLLPWFSRLWYYLLSRFKAKSPAALFEDHRLAEIGRRIGKTAPGVFDYKRGRLLPVFHRQLEQLKEAARFFHTALDAGFNRDRWAFYGLLGSLEMESIHQSLRDAVNPSLLETQSPGLSEGDLRRKAIQAMENLLETIPEESRKAMYFDSRSLYCLKELAFFSFDRILTVFSMDAALRGQCGPLNPVKDLLISLNNILFSARQIPPAPIMESLFVFLLQDSRQRRKEGADISAELERLMTGAKKSLVVIREFNRIVPLTKILRCFIKTLGFCPREISGGEDWLSLYREYWRRHIEEQLAAYIGIRKEQKLQSAFSTLLKGVVLKPLAYTESADNTEGVPVEGAYALSFLGALYSAVFIPDMNDTLKTILLEGQFLLKEDASEFAESYNAFFTIENNIHRFEKNLSPSGDIGRRYAQAKVELGVQPTVKRRRLESIAREASSAALEMVNSVNRASQSMTDLLNRIIGCGAEGGIEILLNLSQLSAHNTDFIKHLGEITGQLQQIPFILDDIGALEAE